METYNYNDFKEAGIDVEFVQDNQSCSTKGVLRGLHFQKHREPERQTFSTGNAARMASLMWASHMEQAMPETFTVV